MPLYRVLGFERVVEMFENKKMHLSHPSAWEDPYETQLRHRLSESFFASCWCTEAVSDAIWRIYSPNKLAVRIKTTVEALRGELDKAEVEDKFTYMIESVEYKRQSDIVKEIKELAAKLAVRFNSQQAARALLLKRDPFEHEAEVRLILYARNLTGDYLARDGYKVSIDPHKLVQGILVDPRAPDAYVHAYHHYFVDVLGYDGNVEKSQLYAQRMPIRVKSGGG